MGFYAPTGNFIEAHRIGDDDMSSTDKMPEWLKPLVTYKRRRFIGRRYIQVRTSIGNVKVGQGWFVFKLSGDQIGAMQGKHFMEIFRFVK
jgi:hypothetical protein